MCADRPECEAGESQPFAREVRRLGTCHSMIRASASLCPLHLHALLFLSLPSCQYCVAALVRCLLSMSTSLSLCLALYLPLAFDLIRFPASTRSCFIDRVIARIVLSGVYCSATSRLMRHTLSLLPLGIFVRCFLVIDFVWVSSKS